MYQTILQTETDGIVTLTLNRPEVMNALSSRLRAELLQAITRLPETARVLVLTGAGRAFCSGQDLADAAALGVPDFERVLRDEYEPLLRALSDCPLPTIAAVNGAAAGAGANLALACDVVIAAESASFIQAFTRIGLIPDAGGTYWLPRQIGAARAMGAALFAEKIPARQAADWGMIWEAVPDADFAAHWQARAAHLAKGPTAAYRAVKQALRASQSNDLDAQLALEARLQGQCGASDDFREGVAAFLEKRPATFTGR
ncbi:2-(1,2-epoxy-1,2-dihydrophenyl)acetyl-CoA isomerase [Cereibacter changlensis JA139]|uniref:2-(1,2-epoxy-1,2-dihydrophenyl)acetyl-CoA isomerase n=2 Tax=Cereibacter changlensis TaxID=402884 RepID=A0A2T4JS88_9RHOB|nr:enoyl-CoA hydratase-related protein [Cereibacter changlensis]PTE20746.1 2-(1,2-epoxy-1,2-dihydrophenyl)acetyl-CoA isomerase [Cereibacter changlensis JA139]PZX54386.1 enoyl-CoA hydratase [Cereibacter changlensis]